MSIGRPKKRKFAGAVTINDDSLEPTPELSNDKMWNSIT